MLSGWPSRALSRDVTSMLAVFVRVEQLPGAPEWTSSVRATARRSVGHWRVARSAGGWFWLAQYTVGGASSEYHHPNTRLQIYGCVQLNSVLFSSSWSSVVFVINKDSLISVCAINCTVDRRTCCSHVQQSSIDSQILAENRDFCLAYLHSMPPLWRRYPSEYCHNVWRGKTKVVWLPDGEKNWTYVYSFWKNTGTWQTDRQTDMQTDTTWRHRPRLCTTSRGKNGCIPMHCRDFT